jgi:hypothetical protein
VTFDLTSGRTLIRGAAWNLLGQSLPVIAAFLFVTLLVQGLGVERLGILSLAWMLIGYFSLFDLGMGGALTRMVSFIHRQGRSLQRGTPGARTSSLGVSCFQLDERHRLHADPWAGEELILVASRR